MFGLPQGDGIRLAPANFLMSYNTRSGHTDIACMCWLSSRFFERFKRQSR